MNKTTLIAGIVGGVVFFAFGFLFYGLMGGVSDHMTEGALALDRGEDVNMVLLVVAHLLMGIFISMIYSKWARGTHNFMHGAQLGALIGLFLMLGVGMIWYATTDMMSMTGHLIDGVFGIVSLGVGTGVISVLYGKMDD